MIPDLSLDPEAIRPSPVRGVQQATILPAVPKRSTTSYATTSTNAAIVPERTQDARERRERMAVVTAPTPQERNAQQWADYEADWKTRIEASDRRDRETMARRIKDDQTRTQAQIERLRKTADFKRQEQAVEMVIKLHQLSDAERSAVWTKLCQSSNPLSTDIAEAACVEIEMTRDTRPVEAPFDAGLDWRGALKK
jgi:hypothetical protein